MRTLLISSIATCAVLAGCADSTQSASTPEPEATNDLACAQDVEVAVAADGVKEGEVSLRPGLVRVTATTDDEQPHYVGLAQLRPGVELATFLNDIFTVITDDKKAQEIGPTIVDKFDLLGGVVTTKGVEQSYLVNLAEGTYYLTDYRNAGGPDAQKRVQTLTVEGDPERCSAPIDATLVATPQDGEVGDRFVTSSTTLPAGGTVAVTNTTAYNVEAVFMPLKDGVTETDISGFFQNPEGGEPPFAAQYSSGGILPIAPNSSAYLPVNVKPGRYAVMSWVENADGKPYLYTIVEVS